MPARIAAITYHLPQRVETNQELARANCDWDMARLTAKSGIRVRHIAAEDETASDLGVAAGRKLLEAEPVPIGEIDFLIYCTESPDHFLPPASCRMQQQLGLGRHAGALDVNLGCSGFVYGLYLAKCFIESGGARNVLLITADTYTKYIHPRDRMVRALFGDGAAAALITSSDGQGGIGQFVLGTDGAGAEKLIVPSGGLRLPRSPATGQERTDISGCTRSADNLFMDGPAIFAFALDTVPGTIAAVLKKSDLAPEQIDWYVYHQANKFMLEALAQRSDVPLAKVVMDLEDTGNLVSASIPVAMQRYAEAGKIRPADRLLLVGFGVGYSWAACVMTWG